jgi:hypothetical protein
MIQIDVQVALARAIKFQLSRVVCWVNRFICKGVVTVHDRRLYATLEEDVDTDFKHSNNSSSL